MSTIEALRADYNLRLARYIAGGGGTEEERAFFFNLCKSVPELDATYRAICAAREAEAADALAEAAPDLVHAFLTGSLPLKDAEHFCYRALQQDTVLLKSMEAVLSVYPHLWSAADRVLPGGVATPEDQERLGYAQVALVQLSPAAAASVAGPLTSGKGIAAHNALHHLVHEHGESIVPEKLADAYAEFRRIHFR